MCSAAFPGSPKICARWVRRKPNNPLGNVGTGVPAFRLAASVAACNGAALFCAQTAQVFNSSNLLTPLVSVALKIVDVRAEQENP